MGSMFSYGKKPKGKFPWAATPTTQPPRGNGSKRKPKSTSRGHQLDPGTKHRSGGYIASSPSGPGATNPRGKKLEYKHEARKHKPVGRAASVYNSAFFMPRSQAKAQRAVAKRRMNNAVKSWLGR